MDNKHLMDLYNQALKDYDEATDRIQELEKINEEHRRLNGELQEENKALKNQIRDKDTIIKYQAQSIRAKKEKIDKAIEYIEKNHLYEFISDKEEIFEVVTDQKATNELLGILKGKNDD